MQVAYNSIFCVGHAFADIYIFLRSLWQLIFN